MLEDLGAGKAWTVMTLDPSIFLGNWCSVGLYKVHRLHNEANGIPELQECIRNAMGNVTTEIRKNVVQEYQNRRNFLLENGGEHV